MLRKHYIKKKIAAYDERMGELFADCEERSVKSFDGTRIAYRTVGEGGPAIVLCPGVFTTYMFFHYLKTYFSPRHKMIFMDYRGHPDSDMPKDLSSFTIENCAKDLKAVMDDAGVDEAVLIGFSMGVMTVLEFYKHWPKRVIGMVPINGPYGHVFSEKEPVEKAITTALEWMSGHTWLVEWFRPVIVLPINMPVAKRVELNPTMLAEEEMTLYFEYVTKMDWHLGFKALAAMSSYDGEGILDKIKVPTLLICGTKDSWTPKRIADEMHRRIKGSEYTKIPGGSHATPAENPDMINFRIDLWLRTYFHEMMAEGAPPAVETPAAGRPKKKSAKKPAKKTGKRPAAKKPAKKPAAKKAAARA
ncbi:MAG: alpha/beta fold hydrolase [Candidatus Geothermincolia bacterium]